MGAGVIAPVIEFSSLNSAVCFLSLSLSLSSLNRPFHIQTIASLRESFRRCRREHTVWNNIGCCKIRRSCIYPARVSVYCRDDQWPEERSPFVTKREREKER
ncbi:hypothetical protein PUN28_009207 [Cardiocondyla obscurior]|uniref:Secreted protein n=1 Tax=Cardiocondyla obscurior TaxID=286306 RepID=A0AAW2FQZ5_9HYME